MIGILRSPHLRVFLNPLLYSAKEGAKMIYLDNAATTWPKPETVYAGVDECLRGGGGNPGRGGHSRARRASYVVYEAREELAALFHVPAATNIVFTYNATDAINMALLGMLKPGERVITTAMEHNAVARPLRYLESKGVELEVIPCDHTGELDLALLEKALQKGAKAVVVTHASNVTGTIMPVAKIGQKAKAYGVLFMVDGAQTAGAIDINVEEAGIDILAFSGHKGLFGPQGTGGLYVKSAEYIQPLRYGGTGSLSELDVQPDFLPDKLESGTPNTPGIAGLLAGVRFIRETGLGVIHGHEEALTRRIMEGLSAIKGVRLYGPPLGKKRSAVVLFTLSGLDSGEVAHRLDQEYQIDCRSGLHCAPWAHRCIGTIETGAVRLSPGYYNTEEEIDKAISAIEEISKRR